MTEPANRLKKTVTFLPNQIEVEVEEGDNLLRAAMEAGVHINASCGGEGVCGKCKIILDKGEVESPLSEHLSDPEYAMGFRLACQTRILGDLVVTIPPESQLDQKILNRERPRKGAGRVVSQIVADELRAKNLFHPPFGKKVIHLGPPTLEDNISDLSRVIRALKQEHQIGNIAVDLPVIREMPAILRKGNWEATVTLAYPRKAGRKINLIKVEPGNRENRNYGIAIDIGTTTVCAQLLDLNLGTIISQFSEYNAQIGYGEDIISRIVYAQKPGGLKKMKELVVSTINSIIKSLIRKQEIEIGDISQVTLAGNTTMIHLLLEIEPRYIREAPYIPTAKYIPPVQAKEIGISVEDHVWAYIFPSVSSYVGGDIVAGVMASGFYKEKELTLYIDIGTNGEIVVGNNDWLACAACSAGPAFEGGGIKFGMRATEGAIEEFNINPTTYEPMILTIGMIKPKGICGSGLINIVSGLLEACVLDQNGKFNPDLKTSRIRQGMDGYEYVLAYAEQTDIGRDVVITEVDIDNLLRAKGAMYAGYVTLLESVGLSIQDLDRVIIAGAFGNYINLEKSITVGLLPDIDLEKFVFIGNGSLQGARLICFSNDLRNDAMEIVEKMTNFELSESTGFMENYIAALFFPHTNGLFFPRVMGRINCMKKGLS
jgi:uncharacterized 2Fe-2S/4Fe-4S cluster protein (DUF4445 family)